MISPFSTYKYSELLPYFNQVDDLTFKRRKFVELYLKVHNKLTSSQSEFISKNIIYKKNNIHIKNVGLLMVYRIKPFNVRFK